MVAPGRGAPGFCTPITVAPLEPNARFSSSSSFFTCATNKTPSKALILGQAGRCRARPLRARLLHAHHRCAAGAERAVQLPLLLLQLRSGRGTPWLPLAGRPKGLSMQSPLGPNACFLIVRVLQCWCLARLPRMPIP